jgi:hypothetical protein
MCPDVIIIERIRAQDATQVLLAECYEVLSALAADRANEPLGKTVLPFCHGEPAEMGLSRMPIARKRRLTTLPYIPSRSRIR